jgi:predicted RNA polymerase sigma factor
MLDGDAIILNQDIDLWDHLLSDEALKRVIKANYTIEMPGDAVIEAHKTPVFTPSEVIPEEVHFVIATDNSGLK